MTWFCLLYSFVSDGLSILLFNCFIGIFVRCFLGFIVLLYALKLSSVRQTVRPWTDENDISREDQVILTRLRVGHSCHCHCHLLLRRPPPRYSYGEDLTIFHVLVSCTAFGPVRHAFDVPPDIATVLSLLSPFLGVWVLKY